MAYVLSDRANFKLPPANVDFRVGGQQIYFRSNMEFVDGVLGISNGGTGNNKFTENRVVIYSNGRFVSSDVTNVQLSALKKSTTKIIIQSKAPTKDCTPSDIWINV